MQNTGSTKRGGTQDAAERRTQQTQHAGSQNMTERRKQDLRTQQNAERRAPYSQREHCVTCPEHCMLRHSTNDSNRDQSLSVRVRAFIRPSVSACVTEAPVRPSVRPCI
eukprot:gene10031-biopygen3763